MTTIRVPLRITFGGGGSDITTGRGSCIAATIDQHLTISVTPTWDDRYILHYSEYENVRRIDEIRHRIIRRVFDRFDVQPGIQVSSIAELPSGSGLGSSGAFTVGLLKALFPQVSRGVAVWACDLDIGQQDQWSAIYGGLNIYDFAERTIRPINTRLGDHLVLYYTGLHHDSTRILTGPAKSPQRAYSEIQRVIQALENDNPEELGLAFTDQWANKLRACPSREHQRISRWIQTGISAGAHGGKLVGAGDGGFICFVTDLDLDETMKEQGLRRLPMTLTDEGATCV